MHHRKAYGAHRKVTAAQQARFITESITRREAEGRPWSFADYGIAGKSRIIEQVHAALHRAEAA